MYHCDVLSVVIEKDLCEKFGVTEWWIPRGGVPASIVLAPWRLLGGFFGVYSNLRSKIDCKRCELQRPRAKHVSA